MRHTSFRAVDDYPLVVFVSLSEGDILRGWYGDAAIALAAAMVICSILSLPRMAAGRSIPAAGARRVDDYEVASGCIASSRITARTSSCSSITPGARRYISPAAERVLGYRPSELLNGSPQDMVHPEDWPRVAASMKQIDLDGHMSPISYRVRRKDGVYLWVETQGEKLGHGEGHIVTIRDISSRKRVEDLLHQANNHLQRMVMLDGLTGVGNRRALDATLNKEYRRAARSQMPLAVLMIDVDHFKKFNDLYGHPAGDACLKSIAGAVGGELRRPADFVARYGGEEFAVILPDTNQAGAAAIAERVRHAVELLSITHQANPAKVATISVGVAVAWPQAAGSPEEELLKVADAALYVAKTEGRNRIHMHEAVAITTAGPDAVNNEAATVQA